jgi:hypothetical protein
MTDEETKTSTKKKTEDRQIFKFTSMSAALDFLHGEYAKFRQMDPESQAISLEYNEEIRKSLSDPTDETRTVPPPLRQLYIDLVMYDEMIQNMINRRKLATQRDKFLLLMASKMATQNQITLREEAKESIVPDVQLESVLRECQDNDELMKARLMQWVPEKYREKLTRRLKYQKSWDKIINCIMSECSVSQLASVDNFRSLFTLMECIMSYCEKLKPK